MNSQEFVIGISQGKQGGGEFHNNYNVSTLQKRLFTLSQRTAPDYHPEVLGQG